MNLAHLDHLTTPVAVGGQAMHITRIYAEPPTYRWVEAPGEGIACVDDSARAAVVYLTHYELTGAPESLARARGLLAFVQFMQAEDGEFFNFVDANLEINRTGPTSHKSFTWWAARAVWALGHGYRIFRDLDPDFAATLRASLERATVAIRARYLSRYGQELDLGGVRFPAWLVNGEADVTAYVLLGLIEYDRAEPQPELRAVITRLADGIARMQLGSSVQYPFRAILGGTSTPAVWHQWGSRQGAALARAGVQLGVERWLRVAEAQARNWFVQLLVNGMLYDMTPAPRPYPQIAYGVSVLVQAFAALYEATGKPEYLRAAGVAASWFAGNNPARFPMYDARTGRGYDGIDQGGSVNLGAGAESTIEALLSMLALAALPAARPYAALTRTEEASLPVILEAESGSPTGGAPRFLRPGSGAGPPGGGSYSGGGYVVLSPGDAMTVDVQVPRSGRYFLYAVLQKDSDSSGQAATVHLAGREVGRLRAGGPWRRPMLWMDLVSETLDLDAGRHVFEVRNPQGGAPLVLDAFLVQPAEAYRVLADASGRRLRVEKDFTRGTVSVGELEEG